MSDISFLVFEDEDGFYRLENNEENDQERVPMTEEEATEQIETLYNQSMLPC